MHAETIRREAVELLIRKVDAEKANKEKKQELPRKLEAALKAGGGYVKSPIILDDFPESDRQVLRGLEVSALREHLLSYDALCSACGMSAFRPPPAPPI